MNNINEQNNIYKANNLKRPQKDIAAIQIELASPEKILEWSFGEVTKSETINYKTQKPEPDGLFCEKIFGPVKDYECACGKYKKIRNKGKICEKCGVEVTESSVRRERFGHLDLAAPISHIWMLKSSPSKIGQLLELKTKEISEVIYFISYIVTDSGDSDKPASNLAYKEIIDQQSDREKLQKSIQGLIKQEVLSQDEMVIANEILASLSDKEIPYNIEEIFEFITKITGAKFSIGAEAIRVLLAKIDINHEIELLNKNIETNKGDITKNIKRLKILQGFSKSKINPSWMIMTKLPVLPPNLRPIIRLDGGRFTSSDVNDLYRRIIIRNDRLKRLLDVAAPKIVINNEKRMLQEAVDAIIDNERKPKPFLSKDKRPLKSLSEVLKGKQGRFRQNLLGKRVDYSGRSVIIVGPELKMHQCGLPRDIAINLYKPFVISELIKRNEELKMNIKIAERRLADRDDEVWSILEDVVKERPVLLNRAPTLHRSGIQAFEPVIIKSKAIRLHPLVTPAFNADFDGDQMAIHLPLSDESVAEARALLIGSKNILGLKDGKPIITPTQDIVLGIYYLCKEESVELKQPKLFYCQNDAILAYENNQIDLQEIILLATASYPDKPFSDEQKKGFIITTTGKIIFNNILPKKMRFINSGNIRPSAQLMSKEHVVVFGQSETETTLGFPNVKALTTSLHKVRHGKLFNKKSLSSLITNLFNDFKDETAIILDSIKNLGFKYSTIAGVTISAFDLSFHEKNSSEDAILATKKQVITETNKRINKLKEMHAFGLLTEEGRKESVIKEWIDAKNKIQDRIEEVFKNGENNNNPVLKMIYSGARGNISNLTQLVGMRGLMNNPKGEIIEVPIKSSFKEGLNVTEFFSSTHGARKGMADTALKTSDSGYLTRRLVDVSQDTIITEEDCHTSRSFVISDIKDTKTNSIIVPLEDRLHGRFLADDLHANGKLIAKKDTLISESLANEIVSLGIERVAIRSLLTCQAEIGVCQKCYGIHLADNELVQIGEAVGVIAAQSIGEPGTQLTMRTFHTGGVAGGIDITQGLPRIKELFDATKPKGRTAIISEYNGEIKKIEAFENNNYEISLEHKFIDDKGRNSKKIKIYKTPANTKLRVSQGQQIKIGQKLTDGSINLKELLEVSDPIETQKYILKEVQRVYRLQGIEISDKYIEIIIRQMLIKLKIIHHGDSDLLIGSLVDVNKLRKINEKLLNEKKVPAYGKPVLLGIKKAPLESDSLLSAASFQDTTRVLANAIIEGKVDYLLGLKENVIIGNLIPVGTSLLTNEEIIEKGKIAKANQA